MTSPFSFAKFPRFGSWLMGFQDWGFRLTFEWQGCEAVALGLADAQRADGHRDEHHREDEEGDEWDQSAQSSTIIRLNMAVVAGGWFLEAVAAYGLT
jgi:hypothetical protein